MAVYDDRLCRLGEGLLWHPERKQLFWFDIMGRALLSRFGEKELKWDFDEYVSAGGWVDRDHILIAGQTSLFVFNLETGAREHVCDLEANLPLNRSNDGRADAHGGFWIGTMGIQKRPKAGSFYRYYRGELRKLYENIDITNGTCFSSDGKWAWFCDTPTQTLMKVALDEEGWPIGEPQLFRDFTTDGTKVDGAVVDTLGNIWIAHWGHHVVRAYKPDGSFLHEEKFPASRISCPVFGGEDYKTLFATSARSGAERDELEREPLAGATFFARTDFIGQRENRVIL